MTLRVVIVDDEPVAVRRLASLVARCDAIVVGTAGTADTAFDLIARERPDLALLDIEMPGADGIDLATRCRALPMPPAIVFVTAFSRFAMNAFDLAADHYLLKPVEPAQIATALSRVEGKIADRRDAARTQELEEVVKRLRAVDCETGPERDFWLSDYQGHVRVRFSDVLWLAAERDYVRIHLDHKSYLARGRIGDLAEKLGAHGFVRIHRSSAVRADCVERVDAIGDRRYRLTLSNGAVLEASRRFASAARALHAAAQPIETGSPTTR
ncbi:MAG: LytTR family DNA-binding domain-containing protein [Pseudomonadota bacterium]|nr:LytTR family DNA-binding domain-containing protein [Pseudomonadota bacterium]